MKGNIIFLRPIFKEMIWGGNRLGTDFGYNIPSENTGECWAIAAHKNGDCMVTSKPYEGKRLSELWQSHRELFGNIKGDTFPLLIKIIDAKQNLSIQVHPDDAYAMKHANGSLGKTECWYVLDCDENASIIIGHYANSKEELKNMIYSKQWKKLIREIPVHKGDFFQIEPGCLHAIKSGTLIMETQQNSDITYRVYDYDRIQNGKPRELHIKQSIDVITAPFEYNKPLFCYVIGNDYKRKKLVECKYYTVEKIEIRGNAVINQQYKFMNISVIKGVGTIDTISLKKGNHFIVPYGYGEMEFSGDLDLIVSYM